MSNIDQSVQEQLEFYGFKYPQITITKRQRLIELANEQLAQNGFSHRNWSIQKMQGVINFDDIYNTGEFDNCNVSVHDLQELYESIKSKTRTTRYYNELYDDLLEESRTLRLSKPSNVFAIYYKQKHASYKQKYPELKGHQLFSKAAMDFKNLKDSKRQKYLDKFKQEEQEWQEFYQKVLPIIDPEGISASASDKHKKSRQPGTKSKSNGAANELGLHRNKPKYPDKPSEFYVRNLENYFSKDLDERDESTLKDNKSRETESPTDAEIADFEERFQICSKKDKLYCIECVMSQLQRYRAEMSTYKLRNDDLTPKKQKKYPLNRNEMLYWRLEILKMPREPCKSAKDHYAYEKSLSPNDATNEWDFMKKSVKTANVQAWEEHKRNYNSRWVEWCDGLSDFNKAEVLLWISVKHGAGSNALPYKVDKLSEEEIHLMLKDFWESGYSKKQDLNTTHNTTAQNDVNSFVNGIMKEINAKKSSTPAPHTNGHKKPINKSTPHSSTKPITSNHTKDSSDSDDSSEDEPPAFLKNGKTAQSNHNDSHQKDKNGSFDQLLNLLQKPDAMNKFKTMESKSQNSTSDEGDSDDDKHNDRESSSQDNDIKKLQRAMTKSKESSGNKDKKKKKKQNSRKEKEKEKLISPPTKNKYMDSSSSDEEPIEAESRRSDQKTLDLQFDSESSDNSSEDEPPKKRQK